MKKVVMFAGPYHPIPPMRGAAVETWMNEVSQKILGYETHLISISSPFLPLKEFKNGIYYHRIHFHRLYKRVFQKILGLDILSYQKRIINLLKNIKPDIIHIHNFVDVEEIIKSARSINPKCKIILHMHNENYKLFKNFPSVDLLVTCSKFLQNFYNKIDIEKKVLYNGVDSNKFSINSNIKEKLNLSLKTIKDEVNICYFGRISPEKGVDKFVELAELMKSYSSFKFFCFGEIATKGDRKKYFDELLKKIEIAKLSNITFQDFIVPSKIYLAYNYADIIIVPSKFEEPFGMVALEALAAGKIVIAAKKGGLIEFLNKENSFLIKDYKNFANETRKVILNFSEEDIKEKTKNALKTAKSFDWINIAIETEKIYRSLGDRK